MLSEKEKDQGVIGESGRLASRGAAILNEPDTESTVVYGLVTFVKWCPKYRKVAACTGTNRSVTR